MPRVVSLSFGVVMSMKQDTITTWYAPAVTSTSAAGAPTKSKVAAAAATQTTAETTCHPKQRRLHGQSVYLHEHGI